MKLELKHLTPYLPYGLRLWNTLMEVDFNLTISEDNCIPNTIHLEYLLEEKSEYKPILRPLSDLTINKFNKINKDLLKNIKTDIVLDHLKKGILKYNHLPYEVIEWFFKNHYDIFGLIEQGLAIDINDLPNI